MKAVIEVNVDLEPFPVPDVVYAESKTGRRQDGMTQPASYRLDELSRTSLILLCDTFVNEVYRRAGKPRP